MRASERTIESRSMQAGKLAGRLTTMGERMLLGCNGKRCANFSRMFSTRLCERSFLLLLLLVLVTYARNFAHIKHLHVD